MCSHPKWNKTRWDWRRQPTLNVSKFFVPGEGRKAMVLILLWLVQHLQHWLPLVHVLPDFHGNSMGLLGILRPWDEEFMEGYPRQGKDNQLRQHCLSTETQQGPAWLWLQPPGFVLPWRAQCELETLWGQAGPDLWVLYILQMSSRNRN